MPRTVPSINPQQSVREQPELKIASANSIRCGCRRATSRDSRYPHLKSRKCNIVEGFADGTRFAHSENQAHVLQAAWESEPMQEHAQSLTSAYHEPTVSSDERGDQQQIQHQHNLHHVTPHRKAKNDVLLVIPVHISPLACGSNIAQWLDAPRTANHPRPTGC